MAATNLATTLPEIAVDNRLASLWYGFSFKADGWQVPDLWDDTNWLIIVTLFDLCK